MLNTSPQTTEMLAPRRQALAAQGDAAPTFRAFCPLDSGFDAGSFTYRREELRWKSSLDRCTSITPSTTPRFENPSRARMPPYVANPYFTTAFSCFTFASTTSTASSTTANSPVCRLYRSSPIPIAIVLATIAADSQKGAPSPK